MAKQQVNSIKRLENILFNEHFGGLFAIKNRINGPFPIPERLGGRWCVIDTFVYQSSQPAPLHIRPARNHSSGTDGGEMAGHRVFSFFGNNRNNVSGSQGCMI